MAHAVDPGDYVEPEPLEDTDGWLTRVFYKVKKLAQTGDAATLLCLILAIAIWLAATILMLSLLSRRKERPLLWREHPVSQAVSIRCATRAQHAKYLSNTDIGLNLATAQVRTKIAG